MHQSILGLVVGVFAIFFSPTALAVDHIQIADNLAESVETRPAHQRTRSSFDEKEKRVTVTAGIGTVHFLPNLTVQAELKVRPRSSVIFGVQGMYGGFYLIGTGSVAFRPYLTGRTSSGLYVETGVHGGVGGIAFAGFVPGGGPHIGLGGKYESRKGFTFDMNVGVTGLINIYEGASTPILPLPTASITFGRSSKRRVR